MTQYLGVQTSAPPDPGVEGIAGHNTILAWRGRTHVDTTNSAGGIRKYRY